MSFFVAVLRPAVRLLGVCVFVSLAGCGAASNSTGKKVNVVAAENEYGDIAQQLGGVHVTVTSLLKSPNTDPHEFEANAGTARDVAVADLVIKNGVGYDSWLDSILGATPSSSRHVLSVGEMLGRRSGDNPHVWYDPHGWPKLAAAITRDLIASDRANASYFRAREKHFLASLVPIDHEIAVVRTRAHGAAAIATEPVFGYMAAAIGVSVQDPGFQKAIMGGTDPSPRDIIQFQNALTSHSVKLLFYNRQAPQPITERMRTLAASQHIPVIGVTETEPSGMSFQRWQMSQLQQVASALGHRPAIGG